MRLVVVEEGIDYRRDVATRHAQNSSLTLFCRSNMAGDMPLGCLLGLSRVASCVAYRSVSGYLLKLLKAS